MVEIPQPDDDSGEEEPLVPAEDLPADVPDGDVEAGEEEEAEEDSDA